MPFFDDVLPRLKIMLKLFAKLVHFFFVRMTKSRHEKVQAIYEAAQENNRRIPRQS